MAIDYLDESGLDVLNEVFTEKFASKESLESKLDKDQLSKDVIVDLIGVFQGATETRDGTSGLVPAPTKDEV